MTDPMVRALDDVAEERARQDEMWGDQSAIADADPTILARLADTLRGHGSVTAVAQRLATEYEIPTPARAKFTTQSEFNRHGGTWAGIVVEEVAEWLEAIVLAHATGDPAPARTEAIQAAACLIAFVEALDRRGLKATPQRPEAGQ